MKELTIQQGSQFIKRLKQSHYPYDKNKLWKKSRRALEIVVQVSYSFLGQLLVVCFKTHF